MTDLERAAVRWIAASQEKEEAEKIIRTSVRVPDDPKGYTPVLVSTGDPSRILMVTWDGYIQLVNVEGTT